jgi:DNA polymerase-3 subunit gamma/tau
MEYDSATNGKVADVQSIREVVLHKHEGAFRIIVLDEAHAITGAAFNSLLKLFEEPPESTVFILVTTDPQQIPRTIHSRALSFDFRVIPIGEIAQRLLAISTELEFDAEPTLLAKIAYYSRGHIRDAIMELDKCYRVGMTSAKEYDDITFTGDFSKDILFAAVHKDHKAVYESVENFFKYSSDLKEFTSQFVDSLISLSKALVGLTVDERTMELSRNISKDQILKCYELVWNMQDRGPAVKNPKSQAHLFTEVLLQVL